MRLRSTLPLVTVVSMLLVAVVSPTYAQVPWQGFEDVPPSSVFYSDIGWLHEQGITRGCNPPDNTQFCPADPVTRGEMAAFLGRALDLPAAATSDWFEDDDASVFESDIDRLAAAGITKGCNPPENTRFCPDQQVTRGQMASFLVRAFALAVGGGVDWFDDDDGSVHANNIDRLRAAWVTYGCNPPSENHFCPDDYVTREQMAALLHRALTQPTDGAAIGVHGSTWPDPLYRFVDMVATFEVRNTGTVILEDVTARPYLAEGMYPWMNECSEASLKGPQERVGNSDAVLDPGEIWDWYCGQPASGVTESMSLEATGTPSGEAPVSAVEHLEYKVLHPVYATVTASASLVTAGEEVTWTINLINRATARLVRVNAEARLNGEGSYTSYWQPETEIVGNGDEIMDPGEVWQYEFTATLWKDSYLDVGGAYASEFQTWGWGLEHVFSEVIKVQPLVVGHEPVEDSADD